MKATRTGRIVAGIEAVLALSLAIFDLFIPALIIGALAVVSLVARREGASTFGLRRAKSPWRMVGIVFGATVAWTLLDVGVLIPALSHLTGTVQDVSDFADVEGNLGKLALFVILSWTLAAFVEEFAFRGYLLTRLTTSLGTDRAGALIAAAVTSIGFGCIHSEQGIVGMVVAAIDGAFFAFLKRYFNGNLWAPILAHGFGNTIGFVTFFFVGPLASLW